MAYFHCRTLIQIRTRTQVPNPMAVWCYAEHVSTDLGLRFGSLSHSICIVQESESESESESGNGNKPLLSSE